jgi:hypothetical protein
MANSTQEPAAITSAGEAYDRKLADEAVRKTARGESLTVREQTALKRYAKERDENLRWTELQQEPRSSYKHCPSP